MHEAFPRIPGKQSSRNNAIINTLSGHEAIELQSMPSINYNNQTARRVPGSQFLYLAIVPFVSREELLQIHFWRMKSTSSRHPLTPSKGVLSCSLLITMPKRDWLCLPSKSVLYSIPSPEWWQERDGYSHIWWWQYRLQQCVFIKSVVHPLFAS